MTQITTAQEENDYGMFARAEDTSVQQHNGKGCLMSFLDGHVEFITVEELANSKKASVESLRIVPGGRACSRRGKEAYVSIVCPPALLRYRAQVITDARRISLLTRTTAFGYTNAIPKESTHPRLTAVRRPQEK